ncbi:MAG TPA: 1-acyl-sn-glycerol-3-phosphate acyltransferase [bacterium]|nr:1-acyl-sn-glycerol-3-phosphate acyltransferase [bacterium]
MISTLRKIFSFKYDDRPMPDRVYEGHVRWIRFLNDYYHRVEHRGYVDEAIEVARKEHVIFISNHAIMLEAAIINCFLLQHGAGKVTTLVFREAFKLPLIREFFRSCQCAPISIENGAGALKKRHILLFPEGMDFISGFVNPDRIPPFHKGFLRMAKTYLQKSGKKSVCIIPIGHAGFEKSVKVWVIRNQLFLEKVVRPFVNYPYIAFPKLPFLLPSKVHMQWGMPVRLTLADLRTERKMSKLTNDFRKSLVNQRLRAQNDHDTALI